MRDEKGQFSKGNPGKPKGAISKMNSELRDKIGLFLEDNWSQIQADFMQLEPKDRINLYERLLGHCLPKLQSIEVSNAFDIARFLSSDESERIEMLANFNNQNNG